MAIYVKDLVGLRAACAKLPGWPKTGKGIKFLSERTGADGGAISRALSPGGRSPLPPAAVKWLNQALRAQRLNLDAFVESRDKASRPRECATTLAFKDGHSAFEHAKSLSVDPSPGLKARVLVWSCEISKHVVKTLVERGWEVEVLISRPEGHWLESQRLPDTGRDDIRDRLLLNVFRTTAIFHFRSALQAAVETSRGAGSVKVFGYQGFRAPFRAMHIPGVGLAVGVYQRERVQGRPANIYGDELPAVFISKEDPAYGAWSSCFEEEFQKLVSGEPPMMTVSNQRSEVEDEWTNAHIARAVRE
jgi:hypothetical protein